MNDALTRRKFFPFRAANTKQVNLMPGQATHLSVRSLAPQDLREPPRTGLALGKAGGGAEMGLRKLLGNKGPAKGSKSSQRLK